MKSRDNLWPFLCLSVALQVYLTAQGGAQTSGSDFSVFWAKFKSAVITNNKSAVADMTKFPLSMPYGVKAVKTKEDFVRRYAEIFNGEASAGQCFPNTKPQKESARQYAVYCPFKKTPNEKENAPIRFIFELTRSGWQFSGLDNINE